MPAFPLPPGRSSVESVARCRSVNSELRLAIERQSADRPVLTGATGDDELMRRVQGDDPNAFARLYDRHVARAYRVARSVCGDASRAEDAVQEGFLSIWRGRASYRPGRCSFKGWAMRVVRNRALDALRHDAAARRPELAELDEGAGKGNRFSALPEESVIARNDNDAMFAALRRLPDAQAAVITLAFFGELTHTEIAEQLALPEGTVKGRMRLGLKKLRVQLDDDGEVAVEQLS